MQLLTASKSLIGIKSATGRYRMAERNLLPKFNSTARTASPVPTLKAESVRFVTELRMKDQAIAQPEAKLKQFSLKQVLAKAREFFLEGGRSALTACAAAGSLVTGTRKKIKPLLCWKNRQLRAKPPKARSARPAVQGELSLDKVKVVRNDLSDTDLEIVPVTKVEQSKSTKPVPRSVSQSEPIEKSWGRLTTRIFGARQTPI